VESLEMRAHDGFSRRRERASTEFAALRSKLDALSPLAVLDRGYSLVSRADGSFVRAANQIRQGELLDMRFRLGSARAKVVDVDKPESSQP